MPWIAEIVSHWDLSRRLNSVESTLRIWMPNRMHQVASIFLISFEYLAISFWNQMSLCAKCVFLYWNFSLKCDQFDQNLKKKNQFSHLSFSERKKIFLEWIVVLIQDLLEWKLLLNFSLNSTDFNRIEIPPVTVNVANSYSATVKPALLWAVIRTLYHEAGSKSSTTKLPPGFTLFEIWFHSMWSLCESLSIRIKKERKKESKRYLDWRWLHLILKQECIVYLPPKGFSKKFKTYSLLSRIIFEIYAINWKSSEDGGNANLLFLMLNDKMWHTAAAILPSW